MADSSVRTDSEETKIKIFLTGLKVHWRLVVLLLWPFVCALIFIGGTGSDVRCLYVVILMAGYWVCEVLPMGVTGLIPIALFPILGILDTKTTATAYLSNTTMMFVASVFIAFAIESSNIHHRIALRTILLLGTTHLKLTFGFMMVTMFVSMWIVNTAATAMMAPVVLAVLTELEQNQLVTVYLPPRNEDEEKSPYPSRTTRCYYCGISYAASIGGTGTMIGTGTNLTFRGIFEERFPRAPSIEFAQWILCWGPMMLIMNVLTWAGLSWQYLGLFRKSGMDQEVRQAKYEDKEKAKESAKIAREVIKQRHKELGPFTWAETWVSVLFLALIALLITTDPNWMSGWGPAISSKKIQDATPAVLICIILFAMPMVPSVFYCMSKDPEKRPKKQQSGILTWSFVNAHMMWGLMFLLGAGFAIAKASDSSGMSKMIANGLKNLKSLHPWVVLLVACVMASIITEFTSNVAVCNILIPVLCELALVIGVNPLYLTFPAAINCSFSFMLPVGTPPNALIAGFVNFRTKDMILSGILPTIFTLIVTVALFPTYGSLIYGNISEYPDWAKATNASDSA